MAENPSVVRFLISGDQPLKLTMTLHLAALALLFCRQHHIKYLPCLPFPTVSCHHDSPQARIGCPGLPRARRAADAEPLPDHRRPALDDHQRAAGDIGQGRERLGGGDEHDMRIKINISKLDLPQGFASVELVWPCLSPLLFPTKAAWPFSTH